MTSTIRGNYPLNTFETVRNLWQKMAETILQEQGFATEDDVRSITNAELLNRESSKIGVESGVANLSPNLPQFLLLQSPKFQALLTGQIVDSDRAARMTIEVTFIPTKIDRFIQPLIPYLPATVELIADPNFTNNSDLQGHFTQLLLNVLIEEKSDESDSPWEQASRQREALLQQQVAQANLLNYIVTQIYQTLDLPIILQAAVERVQTFLHADRLIVYQFNFAKIGGQAIDRSFEAYTGFGKVAYESLGIEQLQSVLDVTEHQDCFDDRQIWHEYRNGMTKAIDRVDTEYAKNQCMLDLMAQSEIKSKLVVPIVVKSELWGLLIAHQCQYSRQWQVTETQFLQQVAGHLALAIDRSELYMNSLWHTKDLEHRVNERTRELRDAVIVAQTANQSKTEFLALLSHELRTPLTSILGLSATLLRLPLLNLTERQQNYLQVIHNSGEHLSELIDDILDFYKLEVGKTFLKVSEFSLSKLIEQVVDLFRVKAEQRKITLQVEIITDSNNITYGSRDLRFRGDTKRVRQILLNILTNAIKFTPENGTVLVRSWIEDCYAVIEVEDSGIGIEEEQIPRLFKKFHQLDRNFDRDYGGMGLGLAITQQLVELHGGSIEVDSIVGSGSTFTVRLASQSLQVAERNDWLEMDRKLVFQDPELNPTPNRIVLIEQDEDLANFMCDILTAARYQVTWLLSAESSFRQISMFEPDLLIIDLDLDAATVDRSIDNIRKSSTISNLKILAIATKDEIVSPIGKRHIDDYLWKQVNPEQLLRKITKLLSHSDRE
ncbi:ATP-binding protein [Chamaesiphon sp. VAR_48_metabat_403]|uniref:sensor histidine kinase n=1 Tax=Chamaesiphon sp. VAR_48_metabat_403 TaxID=2964700 RepID=UPI00286E511F|nr:ATP-binding protein [Chamaesiphon sp. VAR_48_metabat_403]